MFKPFFNVVDLFTVATCAGVIVAWNFAVEGWVYAVPVFVVGQLISIYGSTNRRGG